jgi:hypothetical protein
MMAVVTGRKDAMMIDDVNARESDRMREYALSLETHSKAYAMAADAPGLRKDAARFLFNESMRLHREFGAAIDRADNLEGLNR